MLPTYFYLGRGGAESTPLLPTPGKEQTAMLKPVPGMFWDFLTFNNLVIFSYTII